MDRGLNRQKGADDPADWLPPNQSYQAEYARAWVALKLKWGLTGDAKEIVALSVILGVDAEMPLMAEECGGAINPFSTKLRVAQVDCSAKRYLQEDDYL